MESPLPATPPKPDAPDNIRSSKRPRHGTGGDDGCAAAGGPGRFDGKGFHIDRPDRVIEEVEPGKPGIPWLRYRELLEPVDRLVHLTVVSGTIDLPWMTGPEGFGGLLKGSASLLFSGGSVDPITKKHDKYMAEDVKRALDAVSPELAAVGGWTVIKCREKTPTVHAKLLIARFAGDEPDKPSFLRVYVGSANCSNVRGAAFDAYWVQDFPVIAAAGSTALPDIHSDAQPFRRTLRFFVEQLIGTQLDSDEPRHPALVFFDSSLQGADFSGANGTLLFSLPKRDFEFPISPDRGGPLWYNGIRGLCEALKAYAWPKAACGAPITCLPGALGTMSDLSWLVGIVEGAVAAGSHPCNFNGVVCDILRAMLCVVWPDNVAGILGDQRVASVMSHAWRSYGEDGSDLPHYIFFKAEPKLTFLPGTDPPLSHMALLLRVALGLPPPISDNEIRGWMVVGSANLTKTAWGHEADGDKGQPKSFELGVLLTTTDSSVAAGWLDVIPLKLPKRTRGMNLKQTPMDAQPYPAPSAQVVYARDAPYAPYNYAYDKPDRVQALRDALTGAGNGGH